MLPQKGECVSVACRCPKCHFEFVSSFPFWDGEFTFNDCGERCPRCGEQSELLNGTYQIENRKIIGLRGPDLTIQVAERLRIIADRAREGDIEASDIIAEIAGVSPELAAKIRKYGFSVFGIMMLLFWLIKSVQFNITVDVNELFDQIQSSEQNQEIMKFDENSPIPEEAIIKKPASQTIAGGLKATSQNRKERRRQASLGKRRAKRNA
jgi:hypothetical protein